MKDYHPTPDIREFEKVRTAEIHGRDVTLHLSAIDYGTHTGAVFRVRDAGSDEDIITVPFEAHWHQRGRYMIQVGPVKLAEDNEIAQRIGEIAGAHVSAAIISAQAKAKSRTDMYDGVETGAERALAAIVHMSA